VAGSDNKPAFNTAALAAIVKSFMPHANNGNWQSGSLARNGQKNYRFDIFLSTTF
jgi:hypothetical protein